MIGAELVGAFKHAAASGGGKDTPEVRSALKAVFAKLYKDTPAQEVTKQVEALIPRLKRQLQTRFVRLFLLLFAAVLQFVCHF